MYENEIFHSIYDCIMAQNFSYMPKTPGDPVQRNKALNLSEKLSDLAQIIFLNPYENRGINLLTICYLKIDGEVTDELAVLIGTSTENDRFPDIEKAVAPYQVVYFKCRQATKLI